jgi:hypothetical protein
MNPISGKRNVQPPLSLPSRRARILVANRARLYEFAPDVSSVAVFCCADGVSNLGGQNESMD